MIVYCYFFFKLRGSRQFVLVQSDQHPLDYQTSSHDTKQHPSQGSLTGFLCHNSDCCLCRHSIWLCLRRCLHDTCEYPWCDLSGLMLTTSSWMLPNWKQIPPWSLKASRTLSTLAHTTSIQHTSWTIARGSTTVMAAETPLYAPRQPSHSALICLPHCYRILVWIRVLDNRLLIGPMLSYRIPFGFLRFPRLSLFCLYWTLSSWVSLFWLMDSCVRPGSIVSYIRASAVASQW